MLESMNAQWFLSKKKVCMCLCVYIFLYSLTQFWFNSMLVVLITLKLDIAETLMPGSGQIINRDNIIK